MTITQYDTAFNQLPIKVEPPQQAESPMDGIFPIGRQYGLTGYEASYLHLAIRNGIALATLDEKLRAAARKAKVVLWERK